MSRLVIEEIYKSKTVRDASDRVHPLKDAISPEESQYLIDLICDDETVEKSIEVGCGYGLSSLAICHALSSRKGAEHIAIDPFQFTNYTGIGATNVKRAGHDFFTLIEARSEAALPTLAAKQPGKFDLVFIDGGHTFDQVFIDAYYANHLLRTGGYLVFDDSSMSSVAKVVSHFSNYPAYRFHSMSKPQRNFLRTAAQVTRTILPRSVGQKIVPSAMYDKYYCRTFYTGMVTLKKISKDDRHWKWFKPF